MPFSGLTELKSNIASISVYFTLMSVLHCILLLPTRTLQYNSFLNAVFSLIITLCQWLNLLDSGNKKSELQTVTIRNLQAACAAQRSMQFSEHLKQQVKQFCHESGYLALPFCRPTAKIIICMGLCAWVCNRYHLISLFFFFLCIDLFAKVLPTGVSNPCTQL